MFLELSDIEKTLPNIYTTPFFVKNGKNDIYTTLILLRKEKGCHIVTMWQPLVFNPFLFLFLFPVFPSASDDQKDDNDDHSGYDQEPDPVARQENQQAFQKIAESDQTFLKCFADVLAKG